MKIIETIRRPCPLTKAKEGRRTIDQLLSQVQEHPFQKKFAEEMTGEHDRAYKEVVKAQGLCCG